MQVNEETIRINVVAYNEADFIEKCLDSIKLALETASITQAIVNVVANGCKDNTYEIAKTYCKKYTGWDAYNLELGDKSNAWNYAVQLETNSASLTLFIDGDCTISPQAISSILETYRNKPDSYIIAGVPGTKGNTTEETIKRTMGGKALSGNFYALTPTFLRKVKETGFLLPVGLIGDDSLLAWVSSHDFKLSNGEAAGLLVGSQNAVFYYHRLTPDSLQNIKMYIRRINRYSLRHLQQCCIREHLNTNDKFESLPRLASELYHHRQAKHIRVNSIYGIFDIYNYLLSKTN